MSAAPERDKDVISYTGFTGLRNSVTPERFTPADLDVGDNVNLDETGRLSRRAGRTKITAAATHSLWADRELALCVQGTQLFQIAPNLSLLPRKSGLTAGQRMSYVRINDRVYMSNGAENALLDQGRTRSWGMPVPPYPAVSVGTDNLPAGTYQFVTTYLRNDGQESGARIAARVDVPLNGALTFQFAPLVDPDIVGHNVYLSPPNGNKLYLALTVPVADSNASYAGDTSEFNYDLKVQFLSAPPVGHLVAYFRGRAFVAVDDVIYPSEPHAYELFDLRNYIPADGRVTMLAAVEDKEISIAGHRSGFFIGTDKSCGVLGGSDAAEFKYVPKADYGAIFGALTVIDGAMFTDASIGARPLPAWLTTQGICVGMPDMEIRNITRTKYTFAADGQGTALFVPGPNRFIAISNF